jgi:hypothetical protein
MCTVLLPPGGYPIPVKYIISYYLQLCTVAQYYHRKRTKEPLQPFRHLSLGHVATDAAAPELLSQSVRFYALFVGGTHPHWLGQPNRLSAPGTLYYGFLDIDGPSSSSYYTNVQDLHP